MAPPTPSETDPLLAADTVIRVANGAFINIPAGIADQKSEGGRSLSSTDIGVRVDGHHRPSRKLTYRDVESEVNEHYYDKEDYYSSSLDILASYLKGQKIIYMESHAFCQKRLNYLMFPAIFIRAPIVESVGDNVDVYAKVDDQIVLCGNASTLVASFHPELSSDTRIHEMFLSLGK